MAIEQHKTFLVEIHNLHGHKVYFNDNKGTVIGAMVATQIVGEVHHTGAFDWLQRQLVSQALSHIKRQTARYSESMKTPLAFSKFEMRYFTVHWSGSPTNTMVDGEN